jgi:hypothetical protein
MNNKNNFCQDDQEEMIFLIRHIANFASMISFKTTMGVLSTEETGKPSKLLLEQAADQIRLEADDITDSIRNKFSNSPNSFIQSMASMACNDIWDAAALTIAMIETPEESDDE